MAQMFLIRHGETAWNVEEVYRGTIDVSLSEVGIKQAEALGKHLSQVKLDAIYSSPLKRALETASWVAKYQGIAVIVKQGLIDFNFGEWQGLSEQDVKGLYPALHNEWRTDPQRVRIPGGENLEEVRERGLNVVKEIISEHEGNVALVSHRVVNKVLICSLLGLDNSCFWNIKQDVGGIAIFEYKSGRFVLIKHNDTCYLKEMAKPLGDF